MPRKPDDWSNPDDRSDLINLLPTDLFGVRRIGRYVPGGSAMARAWLTGIGNEEYSLRSLGREIDLSLAWYHRLAAILRGEREMQEHHLLALWEGLSGQREDGSLAMNGLGEESQKARARVVRLAVWYGQKRPMAEQIDYERTYMQKQLDRKRPLKDDLLMAISKVGIRYDWLKTGEGKMYERGYSADRIAPEQGPFAKGELN